MLNTDSVRNCVASKVCGRIISSIILALLGIVILLPVAGFAAQANPEAGDLKQKAQDAFLKGDYARAADLDLEIANKYPDSESRHYAVQMLGTIYEDNIVDLKKAIQWDREFLDKYADSRQVPAYKDKIASLEKLVNQEQAFKTYQSIRFANEGDEVMVQKFEALLKEHPDFLLRDKVESDLGYAYSRLDEQKKSALAFKSIATEGGQKLSGNDNVAYQTADRYWQMRTTWAWVAWAVIGILWIIVLFMKPWKQLTKRSLKRFIVWPALWLLATGASMPFFYSMETTGYPIVIPATTIYTAIGLNLIVLLWLLLLLNGSTWQSKPQMSRWLTPVLALLMTTGVFYLFVVYQPNGPYIVDVCVVKYDYWNGEIHEWLTRHHTQEQSSGQDKSRAELAGPSVNKTESTTVAKESK